MLQVSKHALLLMLPVSAQAQTMVSVIDIDYRDPIQRVVVMSGKDTLTYSSPQGVIRVPQRDGNEKIVFCHKDYHPQEFAYDSIPGVIKMEPLVKRPFEVVIIGHQTDMSEAAVRKRKIEKAEKELAQADPSKGFNILPLISKIIGKLKSKSHRLSKREELKKRLEEY